MHSEEVSDRRHPVIFCYTCDILKGVECYSFSQPVKEPLERFPRHCQLSLSVCLSYFIVLIQQPQHMAAGKNALYKRYNSLHLQSSLMSR